MWLIAIKRASPRRAHPRLWQIRFAEWVCQRSKFSYHRRLALLRLIGAHLCPHCHWWPAYKGEELCFLCENDPDHYL